MERLLSFAAVLCGTLDSMWMGRGYQSFLRVGARERLCECDQ